MTKRAANNFQNMFLEVEETLNTSRDRHVIYVFIFSVTLSKERAYTSFNVCALC